MRTLEDLGISPAPWTVVRVTRQKDAVIKASDNAIIATMHAANARLIAAAPDLYQTLREAVIELCYDCQSCEGYDNGYKCDKPDGECYVQKLRKVLEKVAGEEAK